jgi:hypothetical protein
LTTKTTKRSTKKAETEAAADKANETEEAPPEYPRWWDWQEDGSPVRGTFVRAGTGYTAQGERPFVVLDVEGEERTVWLLNEVLRNQFAREVYRRPSRQIEVGERIEVWRLGERASASSDRRYVNFRVEFPDGPQATQADVFGLPPEAAVVPDDEPESGYETGEEGIPF